MWAALLICLSCLDFVMGQSLNHSPDTVAERNEVFYMQNATFCVKICRTGGNYLHQVSDGTEKVRSLLDLGGNLLDCSVTNDHVEVKSFMDACRLGRNDQRRKRVEGSLVKAAEAKANCLALRWRSKHPGDEDRQGGHGTATGQTLSRAKRGFTYPGTLWCGAGNIADNYEQLGEFAETDSCCRVHDHCPHVIHAFSYNYGYTNFKWHSISHCDCDNALKDCLRRVNDTSSRVVGQAFFNVIEVPCFEFVYEEQCVERHWYGMCKRYDKVPTAVMKQSIPYDFGGIDVIDELTIAPRVQKRPESGWRDSGESMTQPTTSSSQSTAHGEPSIGNMVTVAEDFIKVLATVSTSHSSSTEEAKKEVQGGNRKRKKKKKMEKKRKNKKGKGRKKKQEVNKLATPEEISAVTPSGHKAEDNSLSVNRAQLNHQQNRNANNFMDSFVGPSSEGEFFNKLMMDEPERRRNGQINDTTSSVSLSKPDPSGLQVRGLHEPTGGGALMTRTLVLKSQKSKERKRGWRKNTVPNSFSTSADGNVSDSGAETVTGMLAEQVGTGSDRETGPPATAGSTTTVRPLKTERQKSRRKPGQESQRKYSSRSFPPSTSQTMLSAPVTGGTQTAPEPKQSNTSTTSTLIATSDHAATEFEEQASEGHPEKASVTIASSALSVSPLKHRKEKSKDRYGRKNKRKISPSLPVPASTHDILVTYEPGVAQNAKETRESDLATSPTRAGENTRVFGLLSLRSHTGNLSATPSPPAPPKDSPTNNRQKVKERRQHRKERSNTALTSAARPYLYRLRNSM